MVTICGLLLQNRLKKKREKKTKDAGGLSPEVIGQNGPAFCIWVWTGYLFIYFKKNLLHFLNMQV